MPNAKDLVPSKKFHGIFIGKSGSGKTCASVTIGDDVDLLTGKVIKYSKVYVFDIDDRIKGINGLPALQEKKDAGFIEYDSFKGNTYNEAAEKLMLKLVEIKKRAAMGEIQTVIYSSTTSATELFRNQALASGAIKHNVLLGRTMSQIQDYGYIDRAHRDTILTDLKSLPCNVIIESHLKDDGVYKTDAAGEEVFIKTGEVLNLPGKLSGDCPTWFDETYEFYIDTMIPAQPRNMVKFRSVLAKTTFPNMPIELNWSGKHFFSLLSGISSGKLDKAGNIKK
jgi:hypothetical protein